MTTSTTSKALDWESPEILKAYVAKLKDPQLTAEDFEKLLLAGAPSLIESMPLSDNPLSIFVRGGRNDLIKMAFQHNPALADLSRSQPLLHVMDIAIAEGRFDALKLLMKDVNFASTEKKAYDNDETLLLWRAIQSNRLDIVKFLVEEKGVSPCLTYTASLEQYRSGSNRTLKHVLYDAAEAGATDIVTYLASIKNGSRENTDASYLYSKKEIERIYGSTKSPALETELARRDEEEKKLQKSAEESAEKTIAAVLSGAATSSSHEEAHYRLQGMNPQERVVNGVIPFGERTPTSSSHRRAGQNLVGLGC